MIAPHELKNKTFSRSVRGYNPAEVDQYFDFLIEKYTEAYKAATEFEKKYNETKALYAELAGEEESIRAAILKAQKLGEAIVENAKRDAAKIEADVSDRCDKIVAEAKAKVEAEKANIVALRRYALDFQHKLYGEYVKHLETIKSLDLEELESTVTLQAEGEALDMVKDEVLSKGDDSIDPIITEKSEDSSEEIL